MIWVILFVVSWILFLLLIDWKALKTNIWCGLAACAMQLFVDSQFIYHKLYAIKHEVVSVMGSSLFFILGPVFTIGVLMAQYHPVKKWAIVTYVAGITGLFSLEEFLLVKSKALEYLNWHLIDSIGVNISAMGLLSWISIVILDKRSGKDI